MKIWITRTIACLSLVAGALGVTTTTVAAVDVDTFHGQAPTRLMDTRIGYPTVDGLFAGGGVLAAGGTSNLTVLGRGGVPATGVGAVALNVTVTGPTVGGYLTVFPAAATRPNASNLNFVAGQTIPNMVVVPVGAVGQISLFNGSAGTVNLIADVLGWFPTGPSFSGLVPARLLDTRPQPTIDGLFTAIGRVAGRATLPLTVQGRGGVPLSGVAAVALNVTATGSLAPGFLTVFPTGAAQPTASNLNFSTGQTIPNMVIVPVGSAGQVSIFNGALDAAHVVVDVLGWFPVGPSFTGLNPARLVDTRAGQPTIDGLFSGGGPYGGATANIRVAGRGGVPTSNLGAVALNITVTNASQAGFLTVYPQGAARPNASNLNFVVGQTIANMVIVPVGGGGEVSIYNSANSSDIIVDVLGWFVNPTSPPTLYGNDLVLRSNGLGTGLFGATPASVISLLQAQLGAPTGDFSEAFPILSSGYYLSLTSEDYFARPFGRQVCFGNDICVTFGGFSLASMTFVGYSVGDSGRLIDANGLGVGARGSDFPGAISVIDVGGCYTYGSGMSATGIALGLFSDGVAFATFDAAIIPGPTQRDITVNNMSSGEEIYSYSDC